VPPEKPLRLGLRWSFHSVDGAAGTICWQWTAYDLAGNPVSQCATPFETLTECIGDAKLYGYIEPEKRW
jgi:hypothetical protein